MRKHRTGFVLLFAAASVAVAQMPERPDPAEFPAKQAQAGVIIAVVPVPDSQQAESIFGENAAPTKAGFLPVEVVIFNQGEESIRVDLGPIQVMDFDNRFPQVDPEAVALVLYPKPEMKEPPKIYKPSPFPWPRGSGAPKDKKYAEREEALASLRSRQLRYSVVAPGGYARGYLYFDCRGKSIDLRNSAVHIPRIESYETGQPLLFFEISLKPYALPET